jgi:hypothetical protein
VTWRRWKGGYLKTVDELWMDVDWGEGSLVVGNQAGQSDEALPTNHTQHMLLWRYPYDAWEVWDVRWNNEGWFFVTNHIIPRLERISGLI